MKEAILEATIKIDTERIIDDIDPKIYGVFMEPIGFNRNGVTGNTMYGPVYNPDSPLANDHGFNTAYIDAAKELRLNNMRWPGRMGLDPKTNDLSARNWHGVSTSLIRWVQMNGFS